jgi:opine dehydrogenase
MKNLTFIGAGSTGIAAAGYFGMKGFRATLYDGGRSASNLREIESRGGVQLAGCVEGFGPVRVARGPGEALADADVVLVHVVAHRHEEVAMEIVPYVKSGQHIVICPGNLGCFVFRRVFDEFGVGEGVTISVMQGNLFPCRIVGNATAVIAFPLATKTIASYPGKETGNAVAALAGIVDCIGGKDAFDCALNSTNFVVHLPAAVLSASAVEKQGPGFRIYEAGIGEAVLRCAEKLERERSAIVTSLGYQAAPSPVGLMEDVMNYERHPYLQHFHALEGPDRTSHRYYTEDSLCNGAFMSSVGRRLGVPTPMLDALLAITGAINETDYVQHGRTLENLGFDRTLSIQDVMATL